MGIIRLVDGVFVCEARGRSRAMVHADFIGTFTSLSKANLHFGFSTNLS